MNPAEVRMKLLAFVIASTFGLAAWGLFRLLQSWRGRKLTRADRVLMTLGFGGVALGTVCFLWAFVEPDHLSETHLEVKTHKLKPGERLRIVHISDLHIDGWHRVFEQLPGRINKLEPDLLVFTGDSINKREGVQVLHQVLSKISTRLGRYAVRGNHDVWFWAKQDLFGDGAANELTGERVDVTGTPVTLCGTRYGDEAEVERCLEETPPDRLRVVALHTPDFIERLAPLKPDLYLAGHTHGGQVRVPFYGAIVTESRFDKKYEMGEYRVGDTVLFVSRGVGVEPATFRIRFLCRPEIAVIDLVGE